MSRIWSSGLWSASTTGGTGSCTGDADMEARSARAVAYTRIVSYNLAKNDASASLKASGCSRFDR